MQKLLSLIIFFICADQVNAQIQTRTDSSALSLIFIGDIMGHGSQINSAFDENSGAYNYDSCFKYISPILSDADIAIANLEVTLAGWPYSGYPQFSSPDELAVAMKNAGVDVMVTANNHSCDRRKKGVERTIDVLDSLQIKHTGTFKNKTARDTDYPLILEKNGFKIALLNYTYGTNGIPASKPNIVNLIDRNVIAEDLKAAKSKSPHHIIVFMHWGAEYQMTPNKYQTSLYQFCKENGADLVIGSHPHVIQKMELHRDANDTTLIAYSLGNFISNQRTSPRDGGAILRVEFKREGEKSYIDQAGYFLTWVHTPKVQGRRKFFVLPAAQFENNASFFDPASFAKMNGYIKKSRGLFNSQNINIQEFIYNPLNDSRTLKNNKQKKKDPAAKKE